MLARFAALVATTLIAGQALAQEIKPSGPTTREAAPAPTLKVGDKAPALSVEKWIRGQPVKGFEHGKIYVVEFWATWCGPCRASMPHLSELQKEYKDKGLTIISVNIWEDKEYNADTLAKVEKFVKEQSETMAYTVAYDGPAKVMDKGYMKATNSNGIPTAFVVNQEGTLAWLGHPMDLDFVLEDLVAGKYDIKAGSPRLKKYQEMADKVFKDMRKDPKEALAAFASLEAEFPKQVARQPEMKENIFLAAGEYESAYKLMAERAEKLIAKKDAGGLNEIAWTIVDPEGNVAKKDLDLAIRAAAKAAEFTEHKDAAVLDTLALTHFLKGDIDKAIELQTKAVDLARDSMKEELQGRLDEFNAAKSRK